MDDLKHIFNNIFGQREPRIKEGAYIYEILDRLEEDLQDAFADPQIWEECVMSARDRLASARKWLRGEM